MKTSTRYLIRMHAIDSKPLTIPAGRSKTAALREAKHLVKTARVDKKRPERRPTCEVIAEAVESGATQLLYIVTRDPTDGKPLVTDVAAGTIGAKDA